MDDISKFIFSNQNKLQFYRILFFGARLTISDHWFKYIGQFLGDEWGDLPMIFVASENYWQITSRVTQKSFFTVTNVLSYFLHAILCLWMHSSAINNHRAPISSLSPRTVVSGLALWRLHSWAVALHERGVLALWRHINWLFLRAKIGVKAIFSSEQ